MAQPSPTELEPLDDYIEEIGATGFGFYTAERRYPQPIHKVDGQWEATGEPISGEYYSGFELDNSSAVASFGFADGAKNYFTADGGITWRRFITPGMAAGQDADAAEPGAYIWDARTVNGTYYVLLNYPSWTTGAEEGQWYSSTDGTNYTEVKEPPQK